MPNPFEETMSNTALSTTEASGDICSAYFGTRRQHQVPADWPSPILRFLSPARPSPKPSSRRPAPRSNPPLPAA